MQSPRPSYQAPHHHTYNLGLANNNNNNNNNSSSSNNSNSSYPVADLYNWAASYRYPGHPTYHHQQACLIILQQL